VNEERQGALDGRASSFLQKPSGAGEIADKGIAMPPGKPDSTTEGGQVGTLSEPDKVNDALVPSWTKFAGLNIDEKYAQARLLSYEERDAYLRERCRAAKLEVDSATSALDRATAIVQDNLPFFTVHFYEMDKQGQRSDLIGKVVGKTEWLKSNLPNISKGTFYDAFNRVKSRLAEQERVMLGGEVPSPPQPKTRTHDLTPIQSEVVTALVGQGYKPKDALVMVKAAEGPDFESLFKSALTPREGGGGTGTPVNEGQEESDDATESDERETSEPQTEVLREKERTVVQPTAAAVTYVDWKQHRIPSPDFKLKYFGEASENFKDRYRNAFLGSAFKKILMMLKDNPQQVLAHAHDFSQMAVILRATANNLNLLAAAIETALTPSLALEKEPRRERQARQAKECGDVQTPPEGL
jgi:hypothetical protein